MLRKHVSFANVIACVALFVALGGTAVAATLARDSVGAPQIRTDAVRSPELAPEAVRSSELQDESIKLADVASGTVSALRPDLHFARDDNERLEGVPPCGGVDISICPDFLTLPLSSNTSSRTVTPAPQSEPQPQPDREPRNWLVQAKSDVLSLKEVALVNRCGLVDTTESGPEAVLDQVRVFDSGEDIALSAIVRRAEGNPTIALRCTSQDGSSGTDEVIPKDVKLTALELGSITGP
jgi:hypothetical protein